MTFKDIPAGDTIRFCDAEWNGTAFGNDEGAFAWVASNLVPAGTIIAIDSLGTGTTTASTGSIILDTSSDLGSSDDALFAFLGPGSRTPTTVLAAIGTRAGSFYSSGSLAGSGLTLGVTAILLTTDVDVAAYVGSRTDLGKNNYLAALNNMSNWATQDGSGDQDHDATAPDVPFSTTAFTLQNLSDWPYYKDITINTSGSGASVVNNVIRYPVLVRLTSGNFSDFAVSGVRSSLRFARGETDLPYQVERWDSTGGQVAEIWVLVDTVFGNNSTQSLRMYWGRSNTLNGSNSTAVFDTANSFRAVWHMNESSGDISDATLNAFAGVNNGTTSASSAIGLGRSFNGTTSNYIRIDKSGRDDGGASTNNAKAAKLDSLLPILTVSTWFNANSWGSAVPKLFCRGSSTIKYAFQGTNPGLAFDQNANVTTKLATDPSTGTWHLAHGTYSGGNVNFYVDGALVSSRTGGTRASDCSPYEFVIGARNTSQAYPPTSVADPFNGYLDEMRIQSAARDSNWVKLDYATQRSGQIAVTVGSTQTSSNIPPTGLSYSSNPAVYSAGAAITANTPTLSNGTATTWSISPTLPSGLSFSTSTGIISGTPTIASSSSNYLVTATNSYGSDTETVNIAVNAVAPSALSYSPNAYLFGVNHLDSTSAPAVNNGGGTITYSADDPLPSGLSINATTGRISGTPSASQAATNYAIRATNSQGSTTVSVSIRIAAIPVLSYASNPVVYVKGSAITSNIPTTGDTVTSWSVSPSLPSGLSLSTSTGIISGTPTSVATATNYRVIASNVAGSDTEFVNITVNPATPSVLSYPASAVYSQGDLVTITPSVTCEGCSFSVDQPLPFGMTLNSSTGVISGVANPVSAPRDYEITASNVTGSKMDTINITVNPGEDYDISWANSASMTLNTMTAGAGVTTGQKNFPVLVRLSNAHRTVFQQANADGSDIRFSNAAGGHLAYQIERWSVSAGDTSAAIWVLADTVNASGTTTVRMHWGNGAASSASNGSRSASFIAPAMVAASVRRWASASASSATATP